MTIQEQEKLEELKREKTVHSTEELDRLGWSRYGEIRGDLEASHHGDYVWKWHSGLWNDTKWPTETVQLNQLNQLDQFNQVRLVQAQSAYPTGTIKQEKQ